MVGLHGLARRGALPRRKHRDNQAIALPRVNAELGAMSILAHAHADRLPSLLETVRQGVKQAIARYRHRIACQRAEAELMEMSDRELADLGITRGEIHQKVWGQ